MSKKLLPCPFCGGEARIGLTDRTKWGDTITAFCAPCSASVSETGCVQSEATKRKVTEAWNRRTPAPEGAVVAWRWQEYDHPEDPWLYSETGPREHEEHANRQPLYASPVIPVGSGETLERQAAEIKRLRGVLGGINQLARDRLALIPADLVHGSVIGQLLFDILGRATLTGEDT
jgi:Lar family restriction alleviation protein